MRPRPPPPPPAGPVPSPLGIIDLLSSVLDLQTLLLRAPDRTTNVLGRDQNRDRSRDRSHAQTRSLCRTLERTEGHKRRRKARRSRSPDTTPGRLRIRPRRSPVRLRNTRPEARRPCPASDSCSRAQGSPRSSLRRAPSSVQIRAVQFHFLLAFHSPPSLFLRKHPSVVRHILPALRQPDDLSHPEASPRKSPSRVR